MITANLYVDHGPTPAVHFIIRDRTKLTSIGDCSYQPLFNELLFNISSLPTRQQLHSKRYYIEKNYQFQKGLSALNMESMKYLIVAESKNILKRVNIYASNLN